MGRIDKVAKSAREAGYLEADETPQVFALAKAGQPVVEDKGPDLKAMFSRFALLATDRKLHVFRLGQAGFKKLKEEVVSLSYEEMEAELLTSGKMKGNFEVRRKGETSLWFFRPADFVGKFNDLGRHVESRGVPALNRDYGND